MSRSDTILVFMMILFAISYASIGTTPAVACLIQCSIYHLKTGCQQRILTGHYSTPSQVYNLFCWVFDLRPLSYLKLCNMKFYAVKTAE